MLLPPERADRRRILKAAAFFLTGVGLAFAAAPRCGASVGILFLGLLAALLTVVGGGDDDSKKPPGDAHP